MGIYMMLDAMTALLSFPRVISQRLSRSRITVTRNRFSCSSIMLPLMLPMAQHRVLRAPQPNSLPFSCTGTDTYANSSPTPGMLYSLYSDLAFLTFAELKSAHKVAKI